MTGAKKLEPNLRVEPGRRRLRQTLRFNTPDISEELGFKGTIPQGGIEAHGTGNQL
jgi:hypothetical protein